jgi:TetR/AcrR family transcriptional regulator
MAMDPPESSQSISLPSTAERILAAAEELFAERGFAATSVREIAAAVNLNQASIYNHFPSKQALYEAVLERGLRPIGEILARIAGTELSPAVADAVIDQLVDQLSLTPRLPKLIQREILDNSEYFETLAGQLLRPIYDQGRDTLERQLRDRDWEQGEVPLLVVAFYHLLFGHYAASALIERVSGVDPHSAEMRLVHREFIKKVSRRLLRGER